VLPAKLGSIDPALIGDKQRAALIDNPVIRSGSLSPWNGGPEAVENPQGVEQVQASRSASRTAEIQTLDLTRRQYAMLVALQSDVTITLREMRSNAQHVLRTEPL
jgi:hypothetical protein